MAKNVVRYDLLISCPGDVQTEVTLIKDCVEEFNEKFSDTLGVMVQVRHWKSSSFSQSGNKPQEILNEQFVRDCDAAVAVFWTRFGTPTDKYSSGTEEEIEIMLDAGKQVFMYFSEKAVAPSQIVSEQNQKVKQFREKYEDKGIYFSYASDDDFRKLFFSHLTKYFLTKKQDEERDNKNIPNLILRGIANDNSLQDKITVRKFKNYYSTNIVNYINTIKKLILEINEMSVGSSVALFSNQLLINKKIEIDDGMRIIISNVAECLTVELSDDFFELGGLSEKIGSIAVLGYRNYDGTDDEIKKYKHILRLYEEIIEMNSWEPIERAYKDLKCLYLAIENDGTAIDEDVEITLTFKKDEVASLNERPILSDEDAEYLVKDCNLSELISIQRCATYNAHEDSMKKHPQIVNMQHTPNIFGSCHRDYQEEYKDEFSDALGYEIYDKDEERVIKLQVDYIKHNSVVAFPAPIILKSIPHEVKYEIRSRHIPEVVSGKLEIVE